MERTSIGELLWRGAALATLFLYPLVSGLSDSPFELQWTLQDTLELAVTFAVIGILAAMALAGIERIRQPHGRLAAGSIPHDPFVFDTDRYSPADDPFLQNAENYRPQLRYVDHLIGQLVSELKRHDRFDTATIAVTFDHAYRAVQRDSSRHRDVPLIVKRPQQSSRRDLMVPTQTEALVWSLAGGRGEG